MAPRMPFKRLPLLAACLATLAMAPAAAQSGKKPGQKTDAGPKKIYCWDEGGKRVCGDALPASAVDSARTEINATSGLRTGEVGRALYGNERLQAEAAKRQADALAEAEAARQRRDLAMAESYATEGDLRRAYGERIVLVDEALKGSRLGVTNLRNSLVTLLRQAGELELQGKPVGKALLARIQSQHTDLVRQQVIHDQQADERASLGTQLDAALARYRELKSPATADAATDPAPRAPAPAPGRPPSPEPRR